MTSRFELNDIDHNSGTVIGASEGPVLTGSGAQVTNSEVDQLSADQVAGDKFTADTMLVLQIAGQEAGRRVRAMQWFSTRRLSALAACFVEPDGFVQAQAVLAEKQSVLIAGPAGAGRLTAAAMLLHRVGGASRIRQVDIDLGDEGQPVLDTDQVRQGESLLLDLSTVDLPDYLRAIRELGALVDRVAEVGSLLAVVLPDYERQVPSSNLRGLRVELLLTPRLARDVFEFHLKARGVSPGGSNPLLTAMFDHPRAGELAELAHLVAESMATTGGWDESLVVALGALSNWSAELTETFAEHPDAAWRSLLLSAALLSGCPSDAVFEADRELARLLEFPDVEEHPFARPGLTERLADIGAEIVDGRVRFSRPRYADAVLNHVWRNFPGLRSMLARWIEQLPRLARTSLVDGDRTVLADRFTTLSLRHGMVNDLLQAARGWASVGDNRTTALAVQVLGTAVLDPASGWQFRRRVYAWARDGSVSPRLAGVVMSVCENVLGPAYPEAAMVRLHHLTRHRDETIGLAAVEALLRLVSGPQTRSWLLGRVVARLDNGEPGRDVELFGRLVDPTLPYGATELDLIRVGWRGALARPESVPLLWAWLSASTEIGLDLLVSACDGRTALLGRLRAAAVAWVAEDPASRRQAGLLLDTKIDSAMGLARPASGREE
ncbi:hypothetical protein [Kutzneria kofuensis]|uniref:Uncharacterized protein n=1 Tax=Kutzneria kofuensis TaxID=103725 RepID=A0A7W9KK72_9PSEU|nr:hypothetical protein [Kutzneria kofuensis]MBB5894107.1 hypothetical protein [Kutzneria kofuensis]